MKILNNEWTNYMNYCEQNRLIPTDAGFEIYMESLRSSLIIKGGERK